jgi:hypothetical protein
MKLLLVCIVLTLSIAVAIVLFSAHRVSSHWKQLETACKEKTRERLIVRGAIPTNWMPSLKSTPGNSGLTYLYGSWRVGQKRVQVLCNAKIGSVEKFGYEIGYPE